MRRLTRSSLGLGLNVDLSERDVRDRLDAAYRELIDQDRYLLEVDANERSLTHKLAEHLQRQFPDWNVDCEYNRKNALPKRLHGVKQVVSTEDTDGTTVFPDIVVHKRGTSDNLIVIEAKKKSTDRRSEDREKLAAYKAEHGYRFAFSVVFPVLSGASTASPSTDIMEVVT